MARSFLSKTAGQLARSVDQAFALTALNPPRAMRRSSPAESLGHAQRMRGLAAIRAFYVRDEFMSRHNALLPVSEPISPSVKRVKTLGREGEVVDLRWRSNFEPLWTKAAVAERLGQLTEAERSELQLGEQAGAGALDGMLRELGIDKSGELRDKYLAVEGNRFGYARWLRHARGPRHCLVVLHGYMGGPYALEERMWPVRKLFDSGLDVVFSVLPFHGARRSQKRGFLPPAFPSSDPRFTIEGFRQLVLDHRALFEYLRHSGVASIGVMGMSLGGYAASLLATLEEQLSCAVLFIPLAAIDDFAHANGRMVGSALEQEQQREALRRAQWPVSPLARPSLVDPRKVIVLAGESDLVTGLGHAQRLTHHFHAPLVTFEGGHLLHFGKSRAFEPVFELLSREELIR
ncbi:MAG TPA: hypothetical protein VHM19_01385 [Polyangiales bacterium]|nr:hypothetical protein [Polyangiales bacterium]